MTEQQGNDILVRFLNGQDISGIAHWHAVRESTVEAAIRNGFRNAFTQMCAANERATEKAAPESAIAEVGKLIEHSA